MTYAKEEKVRPNPKSPIMDVYYIMVDPISYGVTAGEFMSMSQHVYLTIRRQMPRLQCPNWKAVMDITWLTLVRTAPRFDAVPLGYRYSRRTRPRYDKQAVFQRE